MPPLPPDSGSVVDPPSSSAARRPAGRLPPRLFLAAITTLLMLGLVELYLRSHPSPFIYIAMRNLAQSLSSRPHPTIQYVNRENYSGEFTNPEFRTHIRISDQGLRDRSFPYKRPPGRDRILILGDSYAFGWGVEADETAAKRLEAGLREVEVLNGGCSGWGTRQELQFLEEQGMRFHPNIVLLMFVENDPVNNFQRYKFVDGRLLEAGEPTGRFADFKRWVMHHSAVWNLVRQGVRAAIDRAHGTGAPEEADRERLWSTTRSCLDEMAALCRKRGAKFGVIYAPNRTSRGEPYHERWFGPLRDYCRGAGIGFLDLVPPLQEASRSGAVYFRLDDHWNRRGNQVAADAIRRYLVSQGWLAGR